MSYTQLSPEWQEWIVDNLERGCQAQTLVQTMIDKGFDAMFANAVVFHFSANPVQRHTPTDPSGSSIA
jgi:prolyl 4-hydroxylase